MSRNKRRKKKRKLRVRCWACFAMQERNEKGRCMYCGKPLTPHGEEEPPQAGM